MTKAHYKKIRWSGCHERTVGAVFNRDPDLGREVAVKTRSHGC